MVRVRPMKPIPRSKPVILGKRKRPPTRIPRGWVPLIQKTLGKSDRVLKSILERMRQGGYSENQILSAIAVATKRRIASHGKKRRKNH